MLAEKRMVQGVPDHWIGNQGAWNNGERKWKRRQDEDLWSGGVPINDVAGLRMTLLIAWIVSGSRNNHARFQRAV